MLSEHRCFTCGDQFMRKRDLGQRFCSKRCASLTQPRKDLADRFWSKVTKTESCWIWTGGRSGNGYGLFWTGNYRLNGSPIWMMAHRFPYQDIHGDVADGLELDHLCRVPLCVNPDHLEPVTHAVNMQRSPLMGSYGRNKVQCVHGHPFDDANTYRWSNGHRACRTCHRERERARKKRLALAGGGES